MSKNDNFHDPIDWLIWLIQKLCSTRQKRRLQNQIPSQKQAQQQYNYILLLALDAERTEDIIQKIRDSKKLTQEAISTLSRTANIEALWQGTEQDYQYYKMHESFHYHSQQKDEYDVYLLKINLNEPEQELNQTMPSTSRARAFQRLLNKEHSVEVSPRLPRESIGNNPHLYR